MRSGAASLRSLRSCRANFRSAGNQDHGSSGVERKTLMSANEERTHGNNHLITCLTRSNGRQCTHDYCVSNSKIAVCIVCERATGTAHILCYISVSFHQLSLYLRAVFVCQGIYSSHVTLLHRPANLCMCACVCMGPRAREYGLSITQGNNKRQP